MRVLRNPERASYLDTAVVNAVSPYTQISNCKCAITYMCVCVIVFKYVCLCVYECMWVPTVDLICENKCAACNKLCLVTKRSVQNVRASHTWFRRVTLTERTWTRLRVCSHKFTIHSDIHTNGASTHDPLRTGFFYWYIFVFSVVYLNYFVFYKSY